MHLEGDASDYFALVRPASETDAQVLRAEQRCLLLTKGRHCASLPSSRRCSRRPMAVTASVVATMTAPGKNSSHQAVEMKSRPAASIAPHSGAGGAAPRPRKLSADAQTMDWPMPR